MEQQNTGVNGWRGCLKTNPLAILSTRGIMPKVGFEPTRAYAHYALNVARLPIPPLRRARYFTLICGFVNLLFLCRIRTPCYNR